jgi:hypothetical protein
MCKKDLEVVNFCLSLLYQITAASAANKLKTADICRELLGEFIINKVNQML